MWQCRSPRRSLELDQLRQRALQRRLELAAPLAQLRRDPRQPEPLVDLLLGRAAQRLAGLVVEDPVLGDVQPAPHRRLAQLHVVRLGAGEVLQDVAELVGRDDAQVDLHARVRDHARARRRRRRRPTRPASARAASRSARPGRDAVAMMSMSLAVSPSRRSEPAISTRSAAGWSRSAPAICSATGSARESRIRGAGPPPSSCSASTRSRFSSTLRAEARGSCGSRPPRPPRAAPPASRRRARRRAAARAWRRSPAGA